MALTERTCRSIEQETQDVMVRTATSAGNECDARFERVWCETAGSAR